MVITKEQWMDWKRHPVTQQYLADVMNTREGKKEEISDGRVSGDELLIEIGRTQGIKDCVEYAIREFQYMEIEENGVEGSRV